MPILGGTHHRKWETKIKEQPDDIHRGYMEMNDVAEQFRFL